MTNHASDTPTKLRPHARRVRKRLRDFLGEQPAAAPPQAESDAARPTQVQSLADGHAEALRKPYSPALGLVAAVSELFLCMPELRRFSSLINDAYEAYMPSWPPLSPVSHSHFTCWSLFDAAIGAELETIGTLFLDFADELAIARERVSLVENAQRSRMGLFVREGQEGDLLWLREIGTGIRRRCAVANGYRGAAGELWFTRLFPSPLPMTDACVVLTSPYIILDPGEAEWLEFLKRTSPRTGIRDEAQAFEHLMKYGLGPRYWLEYIYTAYAGGTDLTIWLRGLPEEGPRMAAGSSR